MIVLFTKEKNSRWMPIVFMLLFLLCLPTSTFAAVYPPVPQNSHTYTNKLANYNPEYEYCLSQVYNRLLPLGNEPSTIKIPGFTGNKEEVQAFAKYVYEYYDYTGMLSLGYMVDPEDNQYFNLYIQFSAPKSIYEMQMATEKKLLDFVKTLNGLSVEEKVIKANDWIASNAVYDTTQSQTSCYANIINGTSTCNGYARAFYAVCSYAGITCENIRGYAADTFHIWNRVLLDGKWSYIDVTWNSQSRSHDWLFLSENQIQKTHVPSAMESVIPASVPPTTAPLSGSKR